MSDVAEERLYGLIEITERQQVAVQAALDGLAAERAALARERKQLAEGISVISGRLRDTVRVAVSESMADAAENGTTAVRRATEPLLCDLAGVSSQAAQAETALRNVVQWASWRLLGWGVAGIAVLVLLGWLASSLVLWWDAGAIGAAQLQKAQLEVEIAGLRANQDEWIKAGMLGKIEHCGPTMRPCIRVDESAGPFGEQSDHRVILGY